MLKQILCAVAACATFFIPQLAHSQNIELGGLFGISYYYGDVSNELHSENVRYGGMVFVRNHLDRHWVLRGNLGYVRIAGIDSVSSDAFQVKRNLNFYTDIFELSGQIEYNLLPDKTRGRRIKNRTIPYVFVGLGLSYFTPKVNDLGTTFYLADLQTSGSDYSQVCVAAPVGIGVRHYLSPRWLIGFEASARFTSTSNLDDIQGTSVYPDPAKLPNDISRKLYDRSTQPKDPDTGYGFGIPGTKRGKVAGITDIYMIFGLTLSYKFNIVRGSRGSGKAMRCPRFY